MENPVEDQIHSVINVEETIGKTVGRIKKERSSRVQEMGQRIYRSRGFRVCPKGVYRFHTHEEADEWMMKMTVARAIKAERKAN